MKKLLLLASMALGIVAFAVPAMAQANAKFWYTDPGEVKVGEGTGNGHPIELTGQLATTLGPVTNGPCEVHATGEVWNSATMGEGKITSFQITAPCPVVVGGTPVCEISEATNSTEEGAEWPITANTDGSISIGEVEFTNTYQGCSVIGIPNGGTRSAEGTATGIWNNELGGAVFNNAGDLTLVGSEGTVPVTIDGSVTGAPNLTLK